MKKFENRVPEFDEIIFENRNKEYGAYDLRKRYIPYMSLSTLGGILFIVLFVFVISLASKREAAADETKPHLVILKTDSTIEEIQKIKTPEPEIKKPDVKPYRYIAPVVVDRLDSTDFTLAAVSEIDTVVNRPVDEIIVIDEEPEQIISEKEPEILIIAEEPPLFPGGEDALIKFIYDNVKYPPEAAENNIEGRVTIKFAVMSDGTVSKAEVLKGVHPSLDSEALRVVRLLPRWKPGKQNGTPVSVWFNVSVKFELKKD